MLSKTELLGQLTNCRNNYILGMSAMSLFAEPSILGHLEKSHASFGEYTITFDQVSHMLASEADRQIAMKEFLTMLLRALIKESFEVIRDYASNSKQDTLLQSQPWFHFARMIRNCISHNFHFHFTNYDHKLLPVSWNKRLITSNLDGEPLGIAFLGYDGVWELFLELERFSVTTLK